MEDTLWLSFGAVIGVATACAISYAAAMIERLVVSARGRADRALGDAIDRARRLD